MSKSGEKNGGGGIGPAVGAGGSLAGGLSNGDLNGLGLFQVQALVKQMDQIRRLRRWLGAVIIVAVSLLIALFVINMFVVHGSLLWTINLIAFPMGAAVATIIMRIRQVERNKNWPGGPDNPRS